MEENNQHVVYKKQKFVKKKYTIKLFILLE